MGLQLETPMVLLGDTTAWLRILWDLYKGRGEWKDTWLWLRTNSNDYIWSRKFICFCRNWSMLKYLRISSSNYGRYQHRRKYLSSLGGALITECKLRRNFDVNIICRRLPTYFLLVIFPTRFGWNVIVGSELSWLYMLILFNSFGNIPCGSSKKREKGALGYMVGCSMVTMAGKKWYLLQLMAVNFSLNRFWI